MATTRDSEPTALQDRPTEQPNPRTEDLDRLPLEGILERILEEDASVPEAVRRALPSIRRAAELLVDVLRAGGRWVNVGAGTSGRLGVLDAAEIPPTFGLAPDRVQGLIAGGTKALQGPVEGAEDDPRAAAQDLSNLELTRDDAVVALSASGRTPYVLGAVAHAHGIGARTVGITCDPASPLAADVDASVVVVVGPEAVAGSTRLKGGLAQKMVLHALSTAAMVRLGRVRGNLMSDIRTGNRKLWTRAVTTLIRVGGISHEEAERRLDEASGDLRSALDRLGGSSG
ncbi:MAG: N-acetylmuramic acid 6-phosphate etherase [Myxococcota bacterium]